MKKHKIANYNFSMTGFVIGLLLITGITIGFSTFFSYGETVYNPNQTNTNAFISYDKSQEIINLTDQMKSQIEQNQTSKTGGLDIFGDFLASGYKTMQLTYSSFHTFGKILTQGMSDNIVTGLSMFQSIIMAIIIVIIFVGIMIPILTKMNK